MYHVRAGRRRGRAPARHGASLNVPKPQQPKSAIQLLVEGKDQCNFFGAFVDHLDITRFQIQDFGGVDELNGFLGVMVKQSGFRDTVKMLGIVRDAETSAERAFQSVRSSLHNARLPVPDRPGERAGRRTRGKRVDIAGGAELRNARNTAVQDVRGHRRGPLHR